MKRFLLSLMLTSSIGAHAGLLEDAESPVTTDAKWILLSGTALTLLVAATESSLSGPWEIRTANSRPLGKYSKYGDLMGQNLPNALYFVGMWVAGQMGHPEADGRAWKMFEATAYASVVATVLKYNVGEGRPYDARTGSSFPSGHSSSAFSFAGVVATEHDWYVGAPAMMLATFVAYSRINDNQHRLHDVIAGATIGLACSYGIHYAHQQSAESALQIMPVTVPGGAELTVSWNF